jgi:hypothetical protein
MSNQEQSPHIREPHSQPPQFLSPEVLLDFSFRIDQDFRAVHGRLKEHDSVIAEHGQRLGELEETADDQHQTLDSIADRALSQPNEITAQHIDHATDERKLAPRFTRRHVAAVTAIAAVAAYATVPKLLESRIGTTNSAVTEANKPTQTTDPAKPIHRTHLKANENSSVNHVDKSKEKHHAKKAHSVEKSIPAAQAARVITSKSVQIVVPPKQPNAVATQPKSAPHPEVSPAKTQQPTQKKPETTPNTPNGGASYGSQVAKSTSAQVGGSAAYETTPSTKAGGAVAP